MKKETEEKLKNIVGKIYRDGIAENMTRQDIRINELYELFSSLLQKEREAIVKKIERMKKTCGLVAHTEPCKHYGVDLYNSALADLIQLIQGEDL